MNEPTQNPEPTFAEQQQAVAALSALAATFPTLPPAFITVHTPVRFTHSVRLDFQIEPQPGFEAWREALQIPVTAVELVTNGSSSWLTARGWFAGTEIEISAHDMPTVAPRTPAERQPNAEAGAR